MFSNPQWIQCHSHACASPSQLGVSYERRREFLAQNPYVFIIRLNCQESISYKGNIGLERQASSLKVGG